MFPRDNHILFGLLLYFILFTFVKAIFTITCLTNILISNEHNVPFILSLKSKHTHTQKPEHKPNTQHNKAIYCLTTVKHEYQGMYSKKQRPQLLDEKKVNEFWVIMLLGKNGKPKNNIRKT